MTKSLRWLIVEDALRDQKGHWHQYVKTFKLGLQDCSDTLVILAEQNADESVRMDLGAHPILPDSIWHRMGDGAGRMRRLLRVPLHALRSWRVLRRFFARSPEWDVIFVPTVLVHHLLGWVGLIKGPLRSSKAHILLFFPNAPVYLDPKEGKRGWVPSPTSKLFNYLIRSLQAEVREGRVILGTETEAMRATLSELTGVPFRYLPHPVSAVEETEGKQPDRLRLGFYGSARAEKGFDVLIKMLQGCGEQSDVDWVVQSVDAAGGEWKKLESNPRIRFIDRHFASGEYEKYLAATDIIVLPYRLSSYALRVSRVAIEAMVNGIPIVATKDSSMEQQASQFGICICCEDGDAASLAAAVSSASLRYQACSAIAKERRSLAQHHYSVREFRRCVMES